METKVFSDFWWQFINRIRLWRGLLLKKLPICLTKKVAVERNLYRDFAELLLKVSLYLWSLKFYSVPCKMQPRRILLYPPEESCNIQFLLHSLEELPQDTQGFYNPGNNKQSFQCACHRILSMKAWYNMVSVLLRLHIDCSNKLNLSPAIIRCNVA